MMVVIGVVECLTGLMGVVGACVHHKKGEAAKSEMNGAAAAREVAAMTSEDTGTEDTASEEE